MQDGKTPMLVLDGHVGLSKHKRATLALQVIIANNPQAFIYPINISPKRERMKEKVLEKRVIPFLNNSCI